MGKPQSSAENFHSGLLPLVGKMLFERVDSRMAAFQEDMVLHGRFLYNSHLLHAGNPPPLSSLQLWAPLAPATSHSHQSQEGEVPNVP